MTGRTHDLAAFTALNWVMVTGPVPQMTLATALVAFSGMMIGGLTPDIDQPTADLWRRLPAGTIVGKILSPLFGRSLSLSPKSDPDSYRDENPKSEITPSHATPSQIPRPLSNHHQSIPP